MPVLRSLVGTPQLGPGLGLPHRRRAGALGAHGEGGGADLALVLEVQEQAVGTLAGRGRREGDVGAGPGLAVAGLASRVDVQIGEITGAQGCARDATSLDHPA